MELLQCSNSSQKQNKNRKKNIENKFLLNKSYLSQSIDTFNKEKTKYNKIFLSPLSKSLSPSNYRNYNFSQNEKRNYWEKSASKMNTIEFLSYFSMPRLLISISARHLFNNKYQSQDGEERWKKRRMQSRTHIPNHASGGLQQFTDTRLLSQTAFQIGRLKHLHHLADFGHIYLNYWQISHADVDAIQI